MEIIRQIILICALISWIIRTIFVGLDIETNPSKKKYIELGILSVLIVFTIVILLTDSGVKR